ncbi:MAG: DciA family protein [Gammaproteobacteria bacterium]
MKILAQILADSEFQQHRQKAALIDQVEKMIGDFIVKRGDGGTHWRVLSLSDELLLAADSPADAARLRQLLPSLTAAVKNDFAMIRTVRLSVQPK